MMKTQHLIVLGALAAVYAVLMMPRGPVQERAPVHVLRDVWTPEELAAIERMVERVPAYPMNIKDQTNRVEHIGEAVPIGPDGKCSHRLLVPNADDTMCVLPGRFDVGLHYIKTGGVMGLKESYTRLVSRLLSFIKFFLSEAKDNLGDRVGSAARLDEVTELKSLFGNPEYQKAANSVCNMRDADGNPLENPVLDPFQLSVIMQLPGQQVPTHNDIAWFWGATRFDYPAWLLACMESSKLFESRRVHQLQGVAYLHESQKYTQEQFGGEFFFYPSGVGGAVESHFPDKNTAILLDGSVQVHGTSPFLPNFDDPVGNGTGLTESVSLDRSKRNQLQFDKTTGLWDLVEVQDDGSHVVRASVPRHQLRMSLVWRARCFADEAERSRYHQMMADPSQAMDLEEILSVFEADLRARGVLGRAEVRPTGVDMAMMLFNTYMPYPLPSRNAWIPLNFCALGTALQNPLVESVVETILSPFCT